MRSWNLWLCCGRRGIKHEGNRNSEVTDSFPAVLLLTELREEAATGSLEDVVRLELIIEVEIAHHPFL